VAVAPASASAAVYAPYQAAVSRIYVAVGQYVHKGDVIAELAQPAARTAYDQARINVQTAESNIKTVSARYDATIAAARQQVKTAEAAVKQAQAGAAAAATQPNTSTTASPGASTTVTMPSTQPQSNELSAAQAQLVTAQQRLATIKASRDDALAPYEQQLTAAEATLKEAQAGVKAGLIRSPISGTVTTINLQAGALPPDARKAPAATVVALDKLQVQGTVKAKMGDAIRTGMPADITFDGVPGEHFQGNVARIDQVSGALGSTSYAVTCDFDNRQGMVKPGVKGLVNIITGEAKNATAVPNGAIIKDRNGSTAVKIPAGRGTRTVAVTTGISDGRFTEIQSGLHDGDRVQVQPSLL
jgi:HlyD family secretion protein